MATDKKISALTALTGANTASDDVFPIVDTSAGETKKITRDELKTALGVLSNIFDNCKVYAARLSQTGTSAPTASVASETLAGAITYGRSDIGKYTIACTDFVAGKTFVMASDAYDAANQVYTPVSVSVESGTINLNSTTDWDSSGSDTGTAEILIVVFP